jgi:hypothetical protein
MLSIINDYIYPIISWDNPIPNLAIKYIISHL